MTSTIDNTTTTATQQLSSDECVADKLTARLDELESTLPRIPSAAVSFGRASTRRSTAIATSIFDEVSSRVESMGSQVSTAIRTATGQARSAAERSATSIKNNAAEAAGQARAQTSAAVDAIESETAGLLDDAADAVDPKTINPASLTDLTKDELYERAQDADIDGRSTMSKAQLVAALRAS